MQTRLNVVIVLDRSGSMQGSEEATVSAINEYFVSLKRNQSCDSFVTLKMFDSESIDTVFRSAPASDLWFNQDRFVPRAMTPLFDAVGDGIQALDEAIANGELGALVVLTDGFENASSKFSKEEISALVRERQEERGWLIIFLAADIDAWPGAKQLGISADRALAYSKSRSPQMSDALQAVTADYVACRDACEVAFDDDMRKSVISSANGDKTRH